MGNRENGGIWLVVKSTKNWMSGLKCLEDLQSGCAPMSIFKKFKEQRQNRKWESEPKVRHKLGLNGGNNRIGITWKW